MPTPSLVAALRTAVLGTAALGTLPLCTQLPDAAQLLDKREATLGTREARAAVKGLVVTGKLSFPGMDLQAPFEELHLVLPEGERVLFTLKMGAFGTTTQGTDGKSSWCTDPGLGVAVQDGPEQREVRRFWAVLRSTPWRELFASARTLGTVERDGRALVELEMLPPEHPGEPADKTERWYLDAQTNELVRVAVVYPGPTGEALPMEWVLEDWRAVDGVLYPHRRIQEVLSDAPLPPGDGGAQAASAQRAPLMRLTYTCDSIRHEALDRARLAPPPDVAAALADPKKRTPKPGPDPLACSLETLAPQPVATIRLEIDADKVSETLAAMLPEVMGAVTKQGGELCGPPFSRYHSIDTAKKRIDLEAGMPVRKPIQPSGRVKPSELPGGKAATTWHVGSYHELQKSYDRLGAWLAAEKLKARGGFWEIYWTDPGLEPNPSTWRTQILWPVE